MNFSPIRNVESSLSKEISFQKKSHGNKKKHQKNSSSSSYDTDNNMIVKDNNFNHGYDVIRVTTAPPRQGYDCVVVMDSDCDVVKNFGDVGGESSKGCDNKDISCEPTNKSSEIDKQLISTTPPGNKLRSILKNSSRGTMIRPQRPKSAAPHKIRYENFTSIIINCTVVGVTT